MNKELTTTDGNRLATVDDVHRIVSAAMDRMVEDISEVIRDFANQVDARFNKIESNQKQIIFRLDRFEERLDSLVGRYQDDKIEQSTRDSRFNKHLKWSGKVAKRLEIPQEI